MKEERRALAVSLGVEIEPIAIALNYWDLAPMQGFPECDRAAIAPPLFPPK
jgi:hypothetical protein